MDKTLEEKQVYSSALKRKYPDRVPVIVEKSKKTDPDIERSKYLVPANLSIGGFIFILRKQIKINPETAIFMFINVTLVPINKSFEEIYNELQNKDGFLYITYSLENTFG